MAFRSQGQLFHIPNDLLRPEPNPIVHTNKVCCLVLIATEFPRATTTMKMDVVTRWKMGQ